MIAIAEKAEGKRDRPMDLTAVATMLATRYQRPSIEIIKDGLKAIWIQRDLPFIE